MSDGDEVKGSVPGDWIRVVYKQQVEPGEVVMPRRMAEHHLRKPTDGDDLERIEWICEKHPNGIVVSEFVLKVDLVTDDEVKQ